MILTFYKCTVYKALPDYTFINLVQSSINIVQWVPYIQVPLLGYVCVCTCTDFLASLVVCFAGCMNMYTTLPILCSVYIVRYTMLSQCWCVCM